MVPLTGAGFRFGDRDNIRLDEIEAAMHEIKVEVRETKAEVRETNAAVDNLRSSISAFSKSLYGLPAFGWSSRQRWGLLPNQKLT
jgi:hypothetical protein